MSAPTPPPSLMTTMKMTITAMAGRRVVVSPPPLRSILSRWMPLVDVVDVAGRGRQRRHEGIWGLVICMVEEEEIHTVVFDCHVTIQPGVDNGGKRSGATLVRSGGRHRQAGEGGGRGAAPRGP